MAAFAMIDLPECYSEPEKVYDQARARGMDFVTITDHDSIDGALELVERGFQDFVIGEEVSVRFPEDDCLLHVLLWGLSPEQHEEIGRLGLRDDVYQFAEWVRHNELAHAFAHPLYIQNGRLTRWHIDRAALLFKGWETLNGAHAGAHRTVVERYIQTLTPAKITRLSEEHAITPKWSRIWHKAVTAGSDDHGRMNIGQTYTSVRCEEGEEDADARRFLRRVMAGHATVEGQAGHSSLLAHQLSTVAVNYYTRKIHPRVSPRGKFIASRLTRFAGVEAPRPRRASLLASELTRRLGRRRRSPLPLVDALRTSIRPVLSRYPDLCERLDPEHWDHGPPVADHERMAQFTSDVCAAISRALSGGTMRALRRRDKHALVDHLLSYLIVHAAQLPYIVSMFYQNKERNLLDRLDHELAEPGSGVSVLERPMRVCLFTDTLGDVNGVSRFIQNVAAQALRTGRDLSVVTSTNFQVPDSPNILNFAPVFHSRMPKYEQLEVVLPPLLKILRHVDARQPDVIHISTPGPVGLIGYLAAKMLRVPVMGVYHTDFPSYIDHLFRDHAFTSMTEAYMRFFYKPFAGIFTRSQQYADSLCALGMQRERILKLKPGIETSEFNPTYRDESIWQRYENEGHAGLVGVGIKVLYVGRVSVEKNMPLLERVWKATHKRCREAGIRAELVVVGDGPYRQTMEKSLKGTNAYFLGFKHGRELSTIYATSDVFVFPSTTDTLGQVVMESQSSGLPVLVTNVGGPQEVVRHGTTGFVLDPQDLDAWTDHLVELIASERLRGEMGSAATAHMSTHDIEHSFEDFWATHERAWRRHLASMGILPRDSERRETDHAGAPSRLDAMMGGTPRAE